MRRASALTMLVLVGCSRGSRSVDAGPSGDAPSSATEPTDARSSVSEPPPLPTTPPSVAAPSSVVTAGPAPRLGPIDIDYPAGQVPSRCASCKASEYCESHDSGPMKGWGCAPIERLPPACRATRTCACLRRDPTFADGCRVSGGRLILDPHPSIY